MSGKKPIVLIFLRCYLPGYKSGGPVRTIANLVEHLGSEFDFRIITSDRDSMDRNPYANVAINRWNQVGSAKVFYASPDQRSVWALAKLINATPHDALYLNSFFNPAFTLNPLMARYFGWLPTRPVVVAPRGEFAPAALHLKRWKKMPYLASAARVFGLYRNVTWQASSEHEAADIRNALGDAAQRIVVAQDLPAAFQPGAIADKIPGSGEESSPLRIVFLSRITPMKNLDFALRVLAKVSVPTELHIFGGINDDGYWKRCQELIHALPKHVSCVYQGPLDHALVHETLAGYDLFFLPTRGENYGHVIFEALAAGVPVLISDQTPWRDLDQAGVGYVLPLHDEEGFAKVIQQRFLLGTNERREQAVRARAYAQKIVSDSHLVEQNRALFINLLPR